MTWTSSTLAGARIPHAFGSSGATVGPPGALATARQVHGRGVVVVGAPGEHGEADALVARDPGLWVAVKTADCVPILVRSSAGVAAIHAGWRGLAANVIAAAVDVLGGDDACASIGPCICAACYEVGPEVVEALAAHADVAAFVTWGPRPHVDLRVVARAQLLRAGVAMVDDVAHCTRELVALASFRRDGVSAGRQLSAIAVPT